MDKNSFSWRRAVDRLASLRTQPLKQDVLAGLTLWGVLVPEGMAYAGMAGMPATAGLYTLLASLPLYFLLGGSPVLVCAATSSESIMMAAVVAPLAGGDPVRYAALTALLVLTTGAIFLAAGLLRLGRVTSFLSKPVMTGFVCGLAIYIAASQLHKMLGMPRGHGDTFMQVMHLAGNITLCNTAALMVGLSALFLLFFLEHFTPRVPAGLCVMALGIAASRIFALASNHGVATVHTLPAGLPSFVLPWFLPADVKAIAPAAAGLALVAFSQALGAEENYARKFGHRVEADRELKALGIANLGSALTGGLLAGGSMSSTAVNVAAGARSRVSSLVTAILIVLTLCFLTPVFQGLPEAVLGAVVMHAVIGLLKIAEMKRYYTLNRNEFFLALIAMGGVVFLDILPGLVLAVAASLLRLIVFSSNISISIMGELRDCGITWVDTSQHPEAEEVPGIRVLRMEGALFFANAEKFHTAVLELCQNSPQTKALALQLKANPRLCITGGDMLLELARDLEKTSVRLAFVDPSPETLRMLRQNGVLALIGENNIHHTIEQAVADLRSGIAHPGTGDAASA